MSKDEETPKKASRKSSSSGQHVLRLEEKLRENDPNALVLAKDRYEKAKESSDPPPPREPLPSSSEVTDAAKTLAESVDKVCEALILVFDKISRVSDEAHGGTVIMQRVLRWMVWIGILQAVICIVTGYMVWHTVETAATIKQTNRSQAEAVVRMAELTSKVTKLSAATEETKKTVNEVKEAADEKPTVELAPDPSKPGDVVVRIVPPKKTDSDNSPSVEGATSVEIPVTVRGVRTPRK